MREKIDLGKNLRRLIDYQTLGCEKLPVTRIVQLGIDAYLLTEPRKASHDHNLGLALLGYVERFVKLDLFRFIVPDAIKQHNQAIAGDERYLSTIVPTRDGLMVALRLA